MCVRYVSVTNAFFSWRLEQKRTAQAFLLSDSRPRGMVFIQCLPFGFGVALYLRSELCRVCVCLMVSIVSERHVLVWQIFVGMLQQIMSIDFIAGNSAGRRHSACF